MSNSLPYLHDVISTFRFQFCPMCREQLTRKVLFDDNILRITCTVCGWIQLVGNAVGVAVVAHSAEGIAVIQPPDEDGIALPAGLVEYGEHPEEAALREVFEETGLEARIIDCMGWIFAPNVDWPGPIIQFIYEVTITGGTLRGSKEGSAHIYPLHDMPPIAPGRAGSQNAMQLYRARYDKQVDSFTLRALGDDDRSWVKEFIITHWGSTMQVVRGEPFYPHQLDGFGAFDQDEVVGLITYRFLDEDTCEVGTLNSLQAGRGIGAALIQAVVDVAKAHGCTRLIVVTTNDNLNALRFYQKRGFVLATLRPNALAVSRQIKPEISLVGFDNIPLRDEIELAMIL